MIHKPHHTAIKLTPQNPAAQKPRRRLIGGREIILVVIALSLLALAPSIAQVTGLQLKPASPVTIKQLGDVERPETNFAGSAVYFMEPEYTAASNTEVMAAGTGDTKLLSTIAPTNTPIAYDGPSIGGGAKPFVMTPGTADHSRALKCLSDAIYYEAATESDAGQRAVAQVIINRMRHPTYPDNICGVIYQGSERRTGCQFSYACDGAMARIPSRLHWMRANAVAASALSGSVYSPVGMATHYHTVNIYPYWAPSLDFLGTIGAHRFYKWKGSAGRQSAFFNSYAGNEPFPGPKPKSWSPAQIAQPLDPIQLQKQYEREYASARLKAESNTRSNAVSAITPSAPYADIVPPRQRPAPSYAAPEYSNEAKKRGGESSFVGTKLPEANNIKPEYQNSGTWKARPAG
jgi:hypothetical protein